ncbi:hypothetical protein HDU76_005397, partial [Blyttiomyces sp. JEL0837]
KPSTSDAPATLKPKLTVGILIFPDVEVLDFCGPFEVFSVTRQLKETDDSKALFTVYTIAESLSPVKCRGGLMVNPHYTIHDHPELDLFVVPGGMGTRKEMYNQNLLDWVRDMNTKTRITASVCTGVFLFAEAGLLKGRKVTTHWGSVNWMRERYSNLEYGVEVVEGGALRFVDDGDIVSSAGISAGIDMSLYLVERIWGVDVAKWTAKRMEYNWSRIV